MPFDLLIFPDEFCPNPERTAVQFFPIAEKIRFPPVGTVENDLKSALGKRFPLRQMATPDSRPQKQFNGIIVPRGENIFAAEQRLIGGDAEKIEMLVVIHEGTFPGKSFRRNLLCPGVLRERAHGDEHRFMPVVKDILQSPVILVCAVDGDPGGGAGNEKAVRRFHGTYARNHNLQILFCRIISVKSESDCERRCLSKIRFFPSLDFANRLAPGPLLGTRGVFQPAGPEIPPSAHQTHGDIDFPIALHGHFQTSRLPQIQGRGEMERDLAPGFLFRGSGICQANGRAAVRFDPLQLDARITFPLLKTGEIRRGKRKRKSGKNPREHDPKIHDAVPFRLVNQRSVSACFRDICIQKFAMGSRNSERTSFCNHMSIRIERICSPRVPHGDPILRFNFRIGTVAGFCVRHHTCPVFPGSVVVKTIPIHHQYGARSLLDHLHQVGHSIVIP